VVHPTPRMISRRHMARLWSPGTRSVKIDSGRKPELLFALASAGQEGEPMRSATAVSVVTGFLTSAF
jgi:hypothetical protein